MLRAYLPAGPDLLLTQRSLLESPGLTSSAQRSFHMHVPKRLRRVMLYVPGSSARMLTKSLRFPADCVAYDLEDSVAHGKKADARRFVADLLDGDDLPAGERMVRVNALGTGYAEQDLITILKTRHVQSIALPKVNEPDHLAYLISMIARYASPDKQAGKAGALKVIAMIESAKALLDIRAIAACAPGHLDGLLFGAEDYCADVGVERTLGRQELLFPRSQIVIAARAYGLHAIDLVCVDYKDDVKLVEESEDGKRLGFTGKQAIHPAQVETIQAAYSPSTKHILRAARILHAKAIHESNGKGAFELDDQMIDAPVIKQAEITVRLARSAGLRIPVISNYDIESSS